MTIDFKTKLRIFQADYAQFNKHCVDKFLCPILFVDDDAALCKAHIVNQAIPDVSDNWTIGRADVDNWYGSFVEANFLGIRYYEGRSMQELIIDKELSRYLNVKLFVNGQPTQYFPLNKSPLPKGFTRFNVEAEDGKIRNFAIKVDPEKLISDEKFKIEVEVTADLRWSGPATLIKSAHLTLFELLGYRYALSNGGFWVGRLLLGEFYDQNKGKTKKEVNEIAPLYWGRYARMVAPLQANTLGLQGTISDKKLMLCGVGSGNLWGIVVFIKIGATIHAVMIPVITNSVTLNSFKSFLRNEYDTVDAALGYFKNGEWQLTQPSEVPWPKTVHEYSASKKTEG